MDRRVKVQLVVAAGVVAVCLAGAWAVHWWHERQLDQAWDAELSACRAAGLAINIKDLLPPKLADEENAALLYEQAAEAWRRGPWPKGADVAWHKALYLLDEEIWAPEDKATVQKVLNRCPAAEALVVQARAKGSSQFAWEADGSPRHGTPIPLVNLAKLMALRARSELEAGDTEGACVAIEDLLRLQDGWKHSPAFLAFMSRQMMLSPTARQMERALSRGVPAAWLKRWAALLPTRADIYAQSRRCVNGEGASLLFAAGEGMRRGLIARDNPGITFEFVPDVARRLRELWARSEQPSWQLPAGSPPQDWAGQDTWWLPGGLLDPLKRDALVARLEMIALALRVEVLRAEGGAYPQGLEELRRGAGAALPEDPFSGQAYHYERVGTGYRLWSVGPRGSVTGDVSQGAIVVAVRVGPSAAAPAKATRPEPASGAVPGAAQKSQSNWRVYWADRMKRQQEEERQKAAGP